MTRDRIRAAVVVILLLIMSAFCFQRFEFTSEITHFLPTSTDRDLVNVSRAITESELTRRMILSVSAPDGKSAVAASEALAARLRRDPHVAWVRNSPDIDAARQEEIYDLYFPRRLLFLSDAPEETLPERLSDDGLRSAARRIRRALAGGTSPMIARIAGADPLGSFTNQLGRLSRLREGRLGFVDGRFVSADGRHGILFLASRASAFRTEDQRSLLATIDRAFEEVNLDHGGALDLELSGIGRFAVASERSIRADITRISILSTACGVLLFLLMFRSGRYIGLLLLSLAAGMVSGLTACLAIFGMVHGITLAFGASLIGVCIDYPIHLFNHHTLHPEPGGPKASLARIWGAVLLGGATTIAGLAGMVWTSFPGIREIALFAPAGIVGALITTRYVLPPLMPLSTGPSVLQLRLVGALTAATSLLGARRGLLVVIISGVSLVGVTGISIARWTDDLSTLNSFDPALVEEDRRVRERVTAMDNGRFIIAMGEDDETALRRNDDLFRRLEQAREDDLIGDFHSLHSLVWSKNLQSRNLAMIRSSPSLASRIRATFEAEGFRPGALDPFVETLRADPAEPLTLDDLRGSPLADVVRPFLLPFPSTGDVGILTFVGDVRDPDRLSRWLEGIDGVLYFDQTEHLRDVYRRFRGRTQQLMAAGLLAVFVLVYLRYRRLRLVLAAFLPALIAAGATLGLLALLRFELNLLNLVGTLLVLSLGVDYGIFMVETRGAGEAQVASLLSIFIASLTTVLSFGLMGLSDNPALRALGLTTGIGSLLSLLLTPIVVALVGLREEAR